MKNTLSILLLFVYLFVFSQTTQEQSSISWKTIEQGDSLQLLGDERLMLVDVYTDWCGYCKVMDNSTFKNGEVAEYINHNFIPVKFNAEINKTIVFKGKSYDWVRGGKNGVNMLAYTILSGRLSYPSYALIDSNGVTRDVVLGYLPPSEFLKALKEAKDKQTPTQK